MKKALREIRAESARKMEKNGAVTPISVKLLRIRPTYDLSELKQNEEKGEEEGEEKKVTLDFREKPDEK